MAWGHRLNTSIVLAAVHGLSRRSFSRRREGLSRTGTSGKGGQKSETSKQAPTRKTKAAVDRLQCPSGIAQRPQHHVIAVPTAIQNRVTKTMSVASWLGNEAKEVQLSLSIYSPALDLFRASFFLRVQLTSLLLILPGLLYLNTCSCVSRHPHWVTPGRIRRWTFFYTSWKRILLLNRQLKAGLNKSKTVDSKHIPIIYISPNHNQQKYHIHQGMSKEYSLCGFSGVVRRSKRITNSCLIHYLPFQRCFTSTETIRLIRVGEPRTATATSTQLPNSALSHIFCSLFILPGHSTRKSASITCSDVQGDLFIPRANT